MRKRNSWVSVRVQTPLGLYPSSSILRDEADLYVDDEIVFSVVKCKEFDIDNDDYYSEVEWANQQEIRFFHQLILRVIEILDFVMYFHLDTHKE